MEQTLVIIKPDGIRRGLIGQVLSRIEAKGYQIVDIRMLVPDRQSVEEHYLEHRDRHFYLPLVDFMTSGPIVLVRAEGHGVVDALRTLVGVSDPTLALPGTIRGDFGRNWGLGVIQNIVHASDSVKSAKRELDIWFP
ncbi:nucleoside-diphosphate kinase [Tropheryma whipplei]|uniref:Nucleoside diphosphate kinase n=1 Tax=Tropheryma whipplei (strain Twist) TaxID=203267 RepID=Q83G54_TROWT|nr:nucleoside-diphosphate kinase [Tropheryma whipplei]AAO44572.1 nucleoside diphosphate kinase [Tropheryma whipplei str. Twist]